MSSSFNVLLKKNININITFKIIGAAAVSANLLCEFNIAPKKDANEIKIKNGKVILVRVIAKLIFSLSSINPGAINETNKGINSCIIKTNVNKIKNNKLKTSFANLLDFFLPDTNSDE